jgi:Putative transposase/Transposase zinc-binding domain
MAVTLAEVLARFGPAYLTRRGLSAAQAKAWRAIAACRTAALGGQRLRCDGCGVEQLRWHSCRNRHCPRCQKQAADSWRRARIAELLDVPYAHLVFTLPHELNALARVHPRWVYETLLACTAATLSEFAANTRWLGGQPAFTLVLHTWTQDLRLHLHTHALMACGALGADGCWLRPARAERFLFPVQALSKVFAGKFRSALAAAECDGALPLDPQADGDARRRRMHRLRATPWVVYAKTPLAGPAAVLDYLSRYTHRTAVGHERLIGVRDDGVRLRVRAEGHGKKIVRIDGAAFFGSIDRPLPAACAAARLQAHPPLWPAGRSPQDAAAGPGARRAGDADTESDRRAHRGRVHAPRGTHRPRAQSVLPGTVARDRTVRAAARAAVVASRSGSSDPCTDGGAAAGAMSIQRPLCLARTAVDRSGRSARRTARVGAPLLTRAGVSPASLSRAGSAVSTGRSRPRDSLQRTPGRAAPTRNLR